MYTPILPTPAPNPPSNLTVSQSRLDSVLTSWRVSSESTIVNGYTIYYQQEGGERYSLSVGANETNATINGLIEGATYSIIIVATSNTLPSTVTGPQNITIGKHSVHWTTPCVLVTLHL